MVVSEPRSSGGGMPLWAKILIGVLIVGALGVACFIAFGVWAVNKFKDAATPAKAAQVVHEMVVIKEPLPTGWAYLLGMDMGPYKIASLMNKENRAMVQFLEIPNTKHLTAQQMADSPNFANAPGHQGVSSFERVSSGDQLVGGQHMYYMIGKAHSATQGATTMQMGFVVLPSGRTIAIELMEPGSKDFDPALAKPILDSIQSFNDSEPAAH